LAPEVPYDFFDGKVLCHTHVIGELACGNIKNREEIISLLQALPMAPHIEFNEYLFKRLRNTIQNKFKNWNDT